MKTKLSVVEYIIKFSELKDNRSLSEQYYTAKNKAQIVPHAISFLKLMRTNNHPRFPELVELACVHFQMNDLLLLNESLLSKKELDDLIKAFKEKGFTHYHLIKMGNVGYMGNTLEYVFNQRHKEFEGLLN